jgi:hypothetical protein
MALNSCRVVLRMKLVSATGWVVYRGEVGMIKRRKWAVL